MDNIKDKIISGEVVLFLGMGLFKDTKFEDGTQVPFDSDSMILALNNGRAMSPRLMYEYSRAAMNIEQKKGREYLIAMTNHIYTSKAYDLPFVYKWLKEIKPKYIVDTNIDDSLQKVYSDTAHILITGVSRITADYDRFVIYSYSVETKEYTRITKEELTLDLPILFKPMGSTVPNKDFIISDADFVDWLTEAMGGYGMPNILKEYRKDKSYLFMGVDFGRDTYRMVSNEITLDLKDSIALTQKDELTKKEKKFFEKHNTEIVDSSIENFIKSL
jgi:hypothetical protein